MRFLGARHTRLRRRGAVAGLALVVAELSMVGACGLCAGEGKRFGRILAEWLAQRGPGESFWGGTRDPKSSPTAARYLAES